ARNPDRARLAIWAALAKTPEARGLVPIEAKRAIELRPSSLRHKGTALLDLAAGAGLRGLFYLGDDRTDLDAFHSLRAWCQASNAGLTIAVLGPETPSRLARAADHYLTGVADVARFLAWLAHEAGNSQ
ncbi:MAG: trehalose-phosphatase, partial [Chloroflexi bacterium]|nr:trehalose-phosphatase [Chloroflexota bacterium]